MTRDLSRTVGGACAALIGAAGLALAEPAAVSLESGARGEYRIAGSFTVSAPSAAAWAVLTDYAGLPGFVSSMKSSRVVEREADHLLLEQRASGRLLFFSRGVKVLLKVREKPLTEISFEDVDRQDFESYAGSWHLQESAGSLRVSYRLDAKRRFAAPEFVAKGVFRRNAAELLEAVRAEIVRRAEGGER